VIFGAIAGSLGGLLVGGKIVNMYHLFFRFPHLDFRLSERAMMAAILVSTLAALAGVYGAVRRATRIPPAEAMRPEPPADYRPAVVERTGIGSHLSHTFRIAVRNLERRPGQSFFTIAGLALATGILIVPNSFRDGVTEVLDFQWDIVERQYASIGLVDPVSHKVAHILEKLPGVTSMEPFRNAASRVRFGHRSRQVMIHGIIPDSEHSRVINADYRRIPLAKGGLVVSAKLGDVLGAKAGDNVVVEFLEGRRLKRTVRLAAFAEDFAGITAYMEMHELNRLLGEGEVINGASFTVDPAQQASFLAELKEIPRVSWVAVKESLRENFRATTAQSINLIQTIYLLFATMVAFGVVYNNARISLAEQARELATLRVIGFSQREVASILVTELTILTLLAIPAGLLLGTGFASAIVTSVNTETVRLPLVLTSKNYAFAALTVFLASGISMILVLRQLKHLDLVGVLKAPE
jgi:putative ABC transport system permease protein